MGDTPNGYTQHYGLRKWADHVNPGADGLNANWDDIDTVLYNMLDLRGSDIQKTDQTLKGNLILDTGWELSADILKVTEIIERDTNNGLDIEGVHFQNEHIENINVLSATNIETESLHNYGNSVFDHTATFNDTVTFNEEIIVKNIAALQNPLEIEGINFYDGRIHALSAPIDNDEPATKGYVDQLTQSLDWQESVLDRDLVSPPASPNTGDRYLLYYSPTAGTDWEGHHKDIAEWDGSQWVFDTPNPGWTVNVEDEDKYYNYNNAGVWILMANLFSHNALSSLQGGQSGEYYHFTQQQHSDILGHISDSTIHFTKNSINHSEINDNEPEKHRLIDDNSIATDKLWSSDKIDNNIALKLDANKVKTVINDTDDEVPTSKAVKAYSDNKNFLQDTDAKIIITKNYGESIFDFIDNKNGAYLTDVVFFRVINDTDAKNVRISGIDNKRSFEIINYSSIMLKTSQIGFFDSNPTGKTTVNNAPAITTAGTADTTYDQTEVDMLNNLKQDVTNLQSKLNELIGVLRGYGLI